MRGVPHGVTSPPSVQPRGREDSLERRPRLTWAEAVAGRTPVWGMCAQQSAHSAHAVHQVPPGRGSRRQHWPAGTLRAPQALWSEGSEGCVSTTGPPT